MAQLISRRELFIGAAGTTLLYTACAEVEEKGELSDETVKAFLAFTDQVVEGEERIAEIKKALGRFLESLRTIRAHRVPQAVEPATMFRARR